MTEARIRKNIHVDMDAFYASVEQRDDPARIEEGVLAMADDVWAWCERTGSRGRTVTVKIKWADFQQSTRSRSAPMAIGILDALHDASLAVIRSVYPPPKEIRLGGVTLSSFTDLGQVGEGGLPELDLGERAA